MIARACYVICDRCGDPAEVSVEGAKDARRAARQQGFRHLKRAEPDGTRTEDVCPRCLTEQERGPAPPSLKVKR